MIYLNIYEASENYVQTIAPSSKMKEIHSFSYLKRDVQYW